MKPTLFFLIGLLFLSCDLNLIEEARLLSPDKNITVFINLTEEGAAAYSVKHKDETVLAPSQFSFLFKGQKPFSKNLQMSMAERNIVDKKWEMPWGEQRHVTNRYNEMILNIREKEAPHRTINILFRAYDDGVAFRYYFPEQMGQDSIIIADELSTFKLTGDHNTWWIPGDWDIYEHLYNSTKFSAIDALAKAQHTNLAQTYIPENAVNTPVTMRTASGLHLSFHEANLTDYAGMTLKVDPQNLSMVSNLVGSDRLGYKVKRALPFYTPWRTIQISEKASGLIESNLIVNLNEPNQIADISWFKPKKYMGIWWEMHLGIAGWDRAGGKHGATTLKAKKLIDFAAANGIGGVLVEGWNTGWEHWIGFEDREEVFDFVTPYPDYNLQAVANYAQKKGVELIMHHETSAAPRTYEQQLDSAFTLMQKHNMHTVKTGYVGKIIPKGEYHHGQWMVNHYRKVLETAAQYNIAINAHEPIKATGIRRTLPNAVSREGLRGQEFNAWAADGGNPPEHLSIVAFTRMLAGPIDFTPGVFDLKLNSSTPERRKTNQINTTLAHQLALYVVLYSPIQMACDLPQNYKGQPAFQFIRDVGVDWEQSKVLNGEIGDFVTIARQERETGNWFVGAISDEQERVITLDFSFLDAQSQYTATIYRDGNKAHWDKNPYAIKIEEMVINAQSKKQFKLAPGGGLAISLMKK